jgi:hypothetical protein
MAAYLIEKYHQSVRRVCEVINLHRSMWYYQRKKDDREVEEKLS